LVTMTQRDRVEHPDLLLINAPIHDYDCYPRYEATHSPPLGLLSIATSVELAGFTVDVYDAELNQASPTQIQALVQQTQPVWVGINSFSVNIDVVRRIVNLLAAGESQIVLGGPHITNVSSGHSMRHFGANVIFVRGDGEQAMIDLLSGIAESRIPGVFSAATEETGSGARPAASDLNELPIIDRRFSKGEPFRRLDRNWYGITLSRGCLFRCSFCAGSSHSNGIPYRTSGIDRTLTELAGLVAADATGIRLFDDLPFKGKRELISFLNQVYARFGSTLSWDINFPLQYCMTLNEEDWSLLRRCGVNTLIFGVEAADPVLRAALGKRVTDAGLWKIIKTANDFGIAVRLYFIIGTPGESASSTDQTLALATKLATLPDLNGPEPITCSVFAYKPMPGSKLWADLLAQGHREDELLRYVDFEMSVPMGNKHAWQSALRLSELSPEQLAERIDVFYTTMTTANPHIRADSIASVRAYLERSSLPSVADGLQ
jgi:anaerobic magnesium-protoporphyrin IX monomethyl ester cyclase